jgi:hypothetical protein
MNYGCRFSTLLKLLLGGRFQPGKDLLPRTGRRPH